MSTASAESYIGSVISLTSKSEIRYEGVLFDINTRDSTIGLRNVRSFGTEGRRKVGSQVPASDKLYEYILFRGTDIKDLQVKSSPPPPPPPQQHSDPAIIQQSQQHSQPASAPSTLPSVEATDLSSQAPIQTQYGNAQSQSSLPLYQPGSTLPQPPAGGASIPSMYWQGYSSALPPHLQQPPWLPQSQTVQHPAFNPPLPSGLSQVQPPSLPPSHKTLAGLSSGALPAMSAPTSTSFSEPLVLPSMEALLANPPPSLAAAGLSLIGQLPSSRVMGTAVAQNLPYATGSKPMPAPGSTLTYQTPPGAMSSTVGVASSALPQAEKSMKSHAESGQLAQIAPSVLSSSLSSQMTLQPSNKEQAKPEEVDTVVKESLLPDPLSSAVPETMEPILPLPNQVDQKYDGAVSNYHHNFRGRGRGRGSAFSRSVTEYTEEFDFTAMNEKFNKDEVWGNLGKNSQSRNRDDLPVEDNMFGYNQSNEEINAQQLGAKPVYVKDDFFDSLSSGTFGRGRQNGRPRYQERFQMDTNTFGDFPRHRQHYRGGGMNYRGGGWGHRGGGHSGGSYYGGRGYGNTGRGDGQGSSYPYHSSY